MRKKLLALGLAILGASFGCMLSVFSISGRFIPWRSIDYFPYPVDEVVTMARYGDEFWVKATDNLLYLIEYPCEKDLCWENVASIPESSMDELPPFKIEVADGECISDAFIPALRKEVQTCITSEVLSPDGTPWRAALVLTGNGDMWIWVKPWESPYDTMPQTMSFAIAGAIFGLLIGLILAMQ